MDPATGASVLSGLASAGPLALILGFAAATLWRKLEALQRCKDPEAKPCGVCTLCRDRTAQATHAEALARLAAAHAVTLAGLGDSVAILAAKVEAQQAHHMEAISEERDKRDALQVELLRLLNATKEDTSHGSSGSGTHTLPA